MTHVSAKPPSHPGRSDFPESGWRRQLLHSAPSSMPKSSNACPYTPLHHRVISTASLLACFTAILQPSIWSRCRATATAHREPLCTIAVLPRSSRTLSAGQQALPRLPRSYWLMRQTVTLLSDSVSLFLQVFAGCCKPLLHDGPSRRYLCASFAGCLDLYPGGLLWCSCPFLPTITSAFPKGRWVGFPATFPHSDFCADVLLGTAVIPLCSGLQLCSPPRSLLPQPAVAGWAAVTFTSELHMVCYLAMRRILLAV
jgi:hypothetical protein